VRKRSKRLRDYFANERPEIHVWSVGDENLDFKTMSDQEIQQYLEKAKWLKCRCTSAIKIERFKSHLRARKGSIFGLMRAALTVAGQGITPEDFRAQARIYTVPEGAVGIRNRQTANPFPKGANRGDAAI
jgi:hypothetical protein